MPRIVHLGRTLELGTAEFVARGGQADVYARDQVAWKIWLDPAGVPDPHRIAALQVVRGPGVVVPDGLVHGEDGSPVGLAMPFLDGWSPVCRLFAAAAKQRVGLGPDGVGALVLRLRALLARAHAAGALVVDLNEGNVLVDPGHTELALIDVDSWQIAGFRASAFADSVRDPHATSFTEHSDWFAFAVVTFQLFAGIHPYRGQHPTVKALTARMQQDLSVFHPDVVVPPMVDLDVLPCGWRDWYEATFALRERELPPADLQAPAPRTPRVLPGATVQITPLAELGSDVRGLAAWAGHLWCWTDQGTYADRRRVGPAPPNGAVPVRSGDDLAFAWRTPDGRVHLQRADGASLPCDLRADALSAWRGDLHVRTGATIQWVDVDPRRPTALPWPVATVAPHATTLFRGLFVQQVLGSTLVGRLAGRTCVQQRVPALDGVSVVDAVNAGHTAVVIARGSSGWVRHVLGPRGDTATSTVLPEARALELPTGIALVGTDDGFDVFEAGRPGPVRPVPCGIPALLDVGGRPGFASGSTVFAMTLGRTGG